MSQVSYNQKGYIGQSMSSRAREAYEDGEMPKSKWTKKFMLEALYDLLASTYPDDEAEQMFVSIQKMSKNDIFDKFFEFSSWHHTGKYAQETLFYQPSEELLSMWREDFLNIKTPENVTRRRENVEEHNGVSSRTFTVDEDGKYFKIRGARRIEENKGKPDLKRFDIELVYKDEYSVVYADRKDVDKKVDLIATNFDKLALISKYGEPVEGERARLTRILNREIAECDDYEILECAAYYGQNFPDTREITVYKDYLSILIDNDIVDFRGYPPKRLETVTAPFLQKAKERLNAKDEN